MKLAVIISGLLLTISPSGFSQLDTEPTPLLHNAISFIQNDGQWHENVNYRAPLGTGSVYLEDNVFTYSQLDAADIDEAHSHAGEDGDYDKIHLIDGHAWRTTFIGANPSPTLTGGNKKVEYHNYFIGNDKNKWASRVPLFAEIAYTGLYDGVDMKVYSSNGFFKYDFIVAPDANASVIAMNYTGLDNIEIRDGNLVSVTTVGEFIENSPYAYQLIGGEKVEIACEFVLIGTTVSFNFPEGYDKSKTLIIDPELIGATLSGGTVTNYGHCATYDNDGNIYGGARSFGPGYPTDDGSFQTDFGGAQDIAVSKYSPDATALIFATYLGGAGNDLPHSMVVNEDDELYVFGSSRSLDYPVSDDAFDTSGPDGGLNADIIVTHLNVDGTDVIGSTFVGGSNNDGLNTLTSNYGDNFRGEIITDNDGNCYIASCTQSSDFPTTAGVYQETLGGGTQDGVIFSMPPDLSEMNWSTYIGGSNGEGALGLRLDEAGDLYVSGVASNEFITMTGYQTSYQGGDRDAFVIHLTNDGESIPESSFWGTTGRDAAFFVDLDVDGFVYLYGQSDAGLSEVTLGVYSNPGSHQFICKLSADLEELEFGTVVGNGGRSFVPIAFMVDACGYTYFSGHSSSGGLPLTDDALFMSGGFYLGVLSPDAIDLEFATLYSGNHVDGGTSRFDPSNGIVYQAVCACGPFTTTDGAYGTVPGGGCDLGLFKIDFGISHVNARGDVDTGSDSEGCAPHTVTFENTSSGISYEWDFGDGSPTTTEFEPTHTFVDPGTYIVTLVAFDPDGCLTSDTTEVEIIVYAEITPDASFDYEVNCATGEITVTYTGTDGVDIVFDMGDGSSYTDSEFDHIYTEDGIFTITLTAGDGFCADFATITEDISIGTPAVDVIFNEPTCTGFSDGSVTLDILAPTGDEFIEIKDADGTVLNGASNTANTLNSGWYYYIVDLGGGCELEDSIFLNDPPQLNAQLLITDPLCFGDKTGRVEIDTVYNWQGSYDEMVYLWAPDPESVSGIGANIIDNLGAGNYTITLNDDLGCARVFDFVITEPDELIADIDFRPALCRVYDYQNGNGVVFGTAKGGVPHYIYTWENLETGETISNTTWGGLNPGNYEFTVTDENGCVTIEKLFLDSLTPEAIFSVNSAQLNSDCQGTAAVEVEFINESINFSDSLDPFADTTFFWNLNNDIDSWEITHSYFYRPDTVYKAHGESYQIEVCLIVINKNDCQDEACKIITIYEPIVFKEINVFSPNGDGKNDLFTFDFKSASISQFNCVIVNRWGVVVEELLSITDGWDGTDRNGDLVKDGTYFYTYTAVTDNGTELDGQGTINVINGKQ